MGTRSATNFFCHQISNLKIIIYIYIFSRNAALKDAHEQIDFQTDFVMDLVKEANYPHNLDVAQIFYDWHHDKVS